MAPPPINNASPAMVVISVLIVVPSIIFIWLARRKIFTPSVRRIKGIDAIDEAVGRSVEMGRPIFMSTGLTGISPLLLAVMGIMGHVARAAARFRQQFFVPQNDVQVMVLIEEHLREIYRDAGRPELFRPETVQYLSDSQFSYASGYMGMVHREKAGSCFLFGYFAAESLILAEAGKQAGAMQVAGTVDYLQIPFFITTTDYTLIGEEVYAAGAYLSDDPVQKGSIAGQDTAKAVILALLLTGIVWATAGTIKARLENLETTQIKAYDVPFAQLLHPPSRENGSGR
ncbi:MAG TPA: hypothetical protein ENN09_01985 [Planctomycetes bacterium]|nr:hypothetical protein [Planctomycetota bacterium]